MLIARFMLGPDIIIGKHKIYLIRTIAMSFSFGFTSNDFSDDELEDSIPSQNISGQTKSCTIETLNPLDSERLLQSDIAQPHLENLGLILTLLKDVRVSFEKVNTPITNATLFRRELFDVKHQLMGEFDELNNSNSTELEILMGETSEDLRKNIYEGGLKSWECSIDLVEYLNDLDKSGKLNGIDTVVELGCGTALPSEFIFEMALKSNRTDPLTLVLSDYNNSVLRLVTIPNLIITWAKSVLNEEQWKTLQTSSDENIPVYDDELLFTQELLEAFVKDLQQRNIYLKFMSGSWSRKFSGMLKANINPSKGFLILTSETIYQPENLPVISETVLDLILSYKATVPTEALVAAKDIYFGVGGSIVEFENYLNNKINKDGLDFMHETFKINSGLKRSIVSIK
ncbi:hypothetical protein Kpol_1039p28 [Vanderwaltozyma polyspora DSM 70294]|uniref:protein-histidine N-methyltransferase n=1 Tax=Vanderwaltozyma polyspora (strain ATCC 22028 / DSM 70294 / BCRC 21397 / CBS 2163 / NBRC 10782 / NRRL Y-8283 / UCD 57-17) TaxID=436907 RepID=A7THF5_VANPO|nr:uncharacterized protein Kpol_1039p28 [Vanderwaltozyma polyspora DSM 70294]EDO18279.1 hypothetical protein Kpol_1039p28 [Vanderwaltozyma polyspora DSM 70294]